MVDIEKKDMRVNDGKLVVKDIRTNKTCEFKERWEAAWFVGTSLEEMERLLELFKNEAMVYCVGDEEYVICDGHHRTPTLGRQTIPMEGFAEVVSSNGERVLFDSYLSVAKHLGLLVGHVIEEKRRSVQGKEPNVFVNDEGKFTIEFSKN